MIDKQLFFNRAFIGVIKQGKAARALIVGVGASCAYRGFGGCRCGIGHNIDDKDYDPDFEGKTVDELPQEIFGISDADLQDRIFLEELQVCHDQACDDTFLLGDLKDRFLEEFRINMENLALKEGLEVPTC